MNFGKYAVEYFAQRYFCFVTNRYLYRLIDSAGEIVADGIPNETLARKFSCAQCTIEALDDAWRYVVSDFEITYDFGLVAPCIHEVAEDTSGKYEEYGSEVYDEAKQRACMLDVLLYAMGKDEEGKQ